MKFYDCDMSLKHKVFARIEHLIGKRRGKMHEKNHPHDLTFP